MEALAAEAHVSLAEPTLKSVRVHLPRQGPVTTEDFVAFASGERVQFCNVIIEDSEAPLEVRLFLPQPEQPPFSAAELPALNTALPVLVRDFELTILATSRAVERESSAEIAASVAVMRAAWAWDDRSEFPVVVNGVRWLAEPRYADDRRWDVTVRSDAG